MKDDRFLFCTKGTSAIGEFNMHKKLFWRDFSINPDDTYVISTQSIWTSRQRSHIQGDKKNIPAKFPGWSITIRKCYEYCLETDTMSGEGWVLPLRFCLVFFSWPKQSFSPKYILSSFTISILSVLQICQGLSSYKSID